MINDVNNLEKKIKDLEDEIREFENVHNEQLNNLMILFKDTIDIIKNKKEEPHLFENTKTNNPEVPDDITLPEIEIVNNEFYGKNPKEIVDYIINNIKVNKENTDNIVSFGNLEENTKKINEVEEKLKNISSSNPITFDNLKLQNIESILDDDNKPIIDLNMDIISLDNNEKNSIGEIYKIKKAISPVELWIDTFKKTSKYQNIINKMYKNIDANNIKLGEPTKLNTDTKLYTSQNLNIELGTIEEKGYDENSQFIIMSIIYVDNMTNEKTTFDLYNCKNTDEQKTMIEAEKEFISENKNLKITNFCIADNYGNKIGWVSYDNSKNSDINEMELI